MLCALQAERNVVDAISQCQVSNNESRSCVGQYSRKSCFSVCPELRMCTAGHAKKAALAHIAAGHGVGDDFGRPFDCIQEKSKPLFQTRKQRLRIMHVTAAAKWRALVG